MVERGWNGNCTAKHAEETAIQCESVGARAKRLAQLITHKNKKLTRVAKRMGAEVAAVAQSFKVELAAAGEQLVQPAVELAEHDYFLSNLDQNVAIVMKTLYLFEAGAEGREPAAVLRQGLSRALVHYYPLAGRLGISREGKLHVEYRNQGVVFVEAEANVRLCELGEILRPDPSLAQLVYSYPDAKSVLEVPPMTVQVTRFRCGGFSLGLCINHCMFDGIGAMEFVHAWAELSRGAAQPSLTPNLDRSILRARQPPLVEFPHLEYSQVPDAGGAKVQQHLCSADELEYRAFRLGPHQVEALKRRIDDERLGVGRRCTTFECLAATAWRCRTMALGMAEAQESKLLFAVDYRSRLQPPLPAGYMGNGIMLTYAMAPAGELASMPLSEAARLVRQAAERVDDAYVRSSIDWFEQQRFCPNLFATLLVSTWSRLSFHTTDFGWGEPIHSGPVGFSEPDVCLFLPATAGKSFTLMLGLRPDAMARFREEVEQLLPPGGVDVV